MNNELFYRLAKISDAADLARIHVICGERQRDSFMPLLGERFLRSYYKIILGCRESVVLIACRRDSGEALGFHSGSLESSKSIAALKDARFCLGFVAITSLLLKPKVLMDVLRRYNALQDSSSSFIIKSGPRGEYWAWLPDTKPLHGAIEVHKMWHHLMRVLGCEFINSEVNVDHMRVRKAVIAMGGEIQRETVDLNGKQRLIVSYNLETFCNRFPLTV